MQDQFLSAKYDVFYKKLTDFHRVTQSRTSHIDHCKPTDVKHMKL